MNEEEYMLVYRLPGSGWAADSMRTKKKAAARADELVGQGWEVRIIRMADVLRIPFQRVKRHEVELEPVFPDPEEATAP